MFHVCLSIDLRQLIDVYKRQGEGIAASKAVEAVGRNPEAEGKIRTMMILGIALSETVAIYGLLVSLILLFVY